MKQLKLTLLYLVIFLFVCTGKNTSRQIETATENNIRQITADTQNETEQQSNSDVKRYRFQCLINNKYPVDLTFELYQNMIQGQIVYTNTKNKTPIYLLGNVLSYDKGGYEVFIREMAPDGSTTGIIRGKITEQNKLEATWNAPDKYIETKNGKLFDYVQGKSYPMHILKIADKETSLYSDKIFDWKPNTNNAYGTYYYSMGENCASGKIEIFPKNKKIMCNIYTNTSAPSFNMAIVEEQECVVKNNRLVCTLSSEAPCQFVILPFKQFVAVEYINDARNCEFGMNATVEGLYLKPQKK